MSQSVGHYKMTIMKTTSCLASTVEMEEINNEVNNAVQLNPTPSQCVMRLAECHTSLLQCRSRTKSIKTVHLFEQNQLCVLPTSTVAVPEVIAVLAGTHVATESVKT